MEGMVDGSIFVAFGMIVCRLGTWFVDLVLLC